MTPVYLTRIDHGRNMARFYTMKVQPTLFGECSLVREWGRIGQAGQTRTDLFPTEAEALTALHSLETVKMRRGYSFAQH